MVDTSALKGVIVSRDKTQEDVARYIGIAPKTFYSRMKAKKFNSDEMKKMIDYLSITNPNEIFFAD